MICVKINIALNILITYIDCTHLDNCANNHNQNLSHGPILNVVEVPLNDVEVPRLGALGHCLELSDDLQREEQDYFQTYWIKSPGAGYLNPLVDAAERGGEVLDGDVHVLQLLAELLPLVVAEGCQVKVDQLGREP